MKKIIWLVLVLLMTFTLTGCNLFGTTEEMKEDPSATEEPIDEESVQEPEGEVEENPGEAQTEPWYRQELSTDIRDADGELRPWYSNDEVTPFVEFTENDTVRFKTIYHEDVREIITILKEQFRITNNLQTITEEEIRAHLTKKYLEDMYEKLGEPFYKWYVRTARENGWVAKSENEVIEGITFSPDGSALATMSAVIVHPEGINLYPYELGVKYFERTEFRFEIEDGRRKIFWIRALESTPK